jgi:hypothetical protein
MLDIYLSDKYKKHWPEIVRLAQVDDAASRKKLRAYGLEACRLSPQPYGLFRHVAEDCVVEEGGQKYNLKTGDEIFVNFVLFISSMYTVNNYRLAQMSILWRSLILWKSNSIVLRARTFITGGARILVLVEKSIWLPILRFYALLPVCLDYVGLLDCKGN